MKYLFAVKLFLLVSLAYPAISSTQPLSESKTDKLITAYTRAYKFNGTTCVRGAGGKVEKMLI